MSWQKIGYGPDLEYANAQCQIAAMGTEQGVVAWGSPSYVAGAQLGNAIGNAIRTDQFMKNCMVLQGWKQVPTSPKTGQPITAGKQPPASSTVTSALSPAVQKEFTSALTLGYVADDCSIKLKSDRSSWLVEARRTADKAILAQARRDANTLMNANLASLSKAQTCDRARKILKDDMKWV